MASLREYTLGDDGVAQALMPSQHTATITIPDLLRMRITSRTQGRNERGNARGELTLTSGRCSR